MQRFAILALVLSMFVAFLTASLVHAKAPSRPNVVIVMTDDQGWGDVGYYGHPHLKTPHLDAMAAAGLRCDRYYSVCGVCSPTRASQLTGRHHDRLNITYANTGRMLNREITIAELAKTQGYTTGHFGKWHLGALTREIRDSRRGGPGAHHHYSAPWHNGFDVCFSTDAATPTYWVAEGPLAYKNAQVRYWTGPGKSILPDAKDETGQPEILGDDSKEIMDRTLAFIEQAVRGGRPFLAVNWFHTPHATIVQDPDYPYDGSPIGKGPEQWPKLWPKSAAHHSSITAMDAQVGRLRRRLQELGVAENTLVIFTSDNGPALLADKDVNHLSTIGDPDGPGGREPIDLAGSKNNLLEGGVRVPGIIEWPGQIEPGTTSVPISNYDILPTLLDLWNIEMPDDRPLDGESIAPILFEKATARKNDSIKLRMSGRSDRRVIMEGRYKAIKEHGPHVAWRLFDIVADPEESQDLSQQKPDLLAELIAKYDAWVETVQASGRGADYQTHVASTSPGVEIVTDVPHKLTAGAWQSGNVRLIVERQLATLEEDLAIDSPGTPKADFSNAANLPRGVISAGTVVDSFLVHFDPGDEATASVTIGCDQEIVGVIADAAKLVASDGLAYRDPVFGDAQSGRGASETDDGGWTIGPDGRCITLNLRADADDFDQVRILTTSPLRVPARKQKTR